MELTKSVMFIFGYLCVACSSLPAHRKVDEITPIEAYGDQPIIDTGVFDGWENPFSSNPFGGLFGSLDGIMERMRQQIASIMNRLPIGKASNDTEVLSFPGGFEQPAFPSISGIDLSKGNTTSITKVIDGHKVVINETEYKNEDDFGGTFFKVRIIDVKSDSSEVTTEKEAEALPENTTQKDREEIANSMENEIFKSREVGSLDRSPQKKLKMLNKQAIVRMNLYTNLLCRLGIQNFVI
uniref:Uncharacterized protein n=1 Tax=Dendroctonus ponderosae TaxID=77166 RepID=J3JUY6_DENPD|nr:unknown [Dendroctonus ponderosae]